MYAGTLPAGTSAQYEIAADGVYLGTLRTLGRLRGDLMVDHAGCVSRYGVVSDSDTMTPVVGATVKLRDKTTVTGADGWYRLDLGCPDPNAPDFGTTFIHVTRASYADGSFVAGRVRYDLQIKHK
jgi:hypothetical protein